MTSTNKIRLLVGLIIILLGYLLVYPKIFDAKLDTGGDNYNYLNYSRSISEGNGYTSPYSPEHNPTNWFPPGYSVLLTLVKQDVMGAKIMNGVLYFLSIIGIYISVFMLTQNVSIAFVSSIFLVFSPGLMRLSTVIYSEIPFVFASIATILALMKYPQKWIVLSVFTAMAVYFRSVGFALAGAVFLHLYFRESKIESYKYFGATFILYLPYMIRNHVLGLEGRYVSAILSKNVWRPEEGSLDAVGVIEKVGVNFQEVVLNGFPKAMFPFTEKYPLVLCILFLAMLFWGAYKMGRYNLFFIGFIVLNMIILLSWHGGNDIRYVWPIVPVLYTCFFVGIWKIISQKKIILISLILIPFFAVPLKRVMAPEYPQPYKDYIELGILIEKEKHPEWMVVCRKPEVLHYYSKTYATRYKYSLNDKDLIRHFEDIDADFIVLDALGYSSTPRYLYPAIQNNQDRFRLIGRSSQTETYLLQFVK